MKDKYGVPRIFNEYPILSNNPYRTVRKMGMSGFSILAKRFRELEKDLTKGLVKWKIKREGRPPPDEETLDKGSERIVEEAHRVVKKSGKHIFEELKTAKKEFLKAYRDESDDKKE